MLEELGVSTPLEISDVTVPELILAFTKLIQGEYVEFFISFSATAIYKM